MSTHIDSWDYKCWNDCRSSGCPGHTVTFKFQDTADTVSIRVDNEDPYFIDRSITPRLARWLEMTELDR